MVMYSTRGVTVIKMILVTIIIMVVVLGTYFAIDAAQKRTRDTKRIADIKTLYKALSIYQTLYGNFPLADKPIRITGKDVVSTALLNSNSMQETMRDPLYPDYHYTYQVDVSGNNFSIRFCLESRYIKGYEIGCDNYIKP